MTQTEIIYLILAALALVLSAFFSSAETAYISLQKIKIKEMASRGAPNAKAVCQIVERPERLLSTILLGNNFVNTAAATLATAVALSLLAGDEGIALITATVIVTLVLLILAEIAPKITAAQHSERVALLYVRPMKFFNFILWPFATVLEWIGTGISRMVGGEVKRPSTLVSEEEIRTMITVGRTEGTVEEAEATMLHSVFEFGDLPVHDIMTPRADIVWVEKGTTLDAFLQTYASATHTRFPVYENKPDQVCGMLSIKDVLLALAEHRLTGEDPIDSLIRPVTIVPDSKKIGQLFRELQSSGNQMAVVVDEWGGIDGMVTLEKLVEQIVGQIGDELLRQAVEYQTIDERTYEVDGDMRIEDANEMLSLSIPEGDYETLAGFMLEKLGRIPKEGNELRWENLRLIVKQMRNLRIEKIRVIKEVS